ncbi:MAG: hypothetical protein KF900_13340 [Bacteroidetes bacterium]|nr:hypothetical protein [Bacteroidota bacterium]
MRNQKKLENAFQKIENIHYNNEHGGAYAYLQFMAYTRELQTLLRPMKNVQRHLESIDAINWLFNEYLTMNFTHRHKALFEDKLSEIKLIFEAIRSTPFEKEILVKTTARHPFDGKLYQQAA